MTDPSTKRKPQLAVVISHPIQHFCPQYHSFSRNKAWDTKVFFASSRGLEPYKDSGFGAEVHWEGLALDFPHEFLNDGRAIPIGPKIDAPDLVEKLETAVPDILLLYGYSQRLQRRALAWARQHGKAVLMFSDSENRQKRAWYKKSLKKFILPRIYRRVDAFLTTGDANEDYYQMYGVPAHKLVRSPYPIDRSHFNQVREKKQVLRQKIRERWSITEDDVLVMVAGKLVPWKRQIDLIRGLKRLKNTRVRVVAAVVGSGPDLESVELEAQGLSHHRAVFPGFVQPTELAEYYAAADVYVHTSAKEPHSVAISEALYMGCPLIISDRCGSYGPTDDLRPGVNGFVYPCGDAAALATRIAQLADDAALRAKFSSASTVIADQSQELAHGRGLEAALIALGLIK